MKKNKINSKTTDYSKEIKKYFFLNLQYCDGVSFEFPGDCMPDKRKVIYATSRGFECTFAFRKDSIRGAEIIERYRTNCLDGEKIKESSAVYKLFKSYWKPEQKAILLWVEPKSDKTFPKITYYESFCIYGFFGFSYTKLTEEGDSKNIEKFTKVKEAKEPGDDTSLGILKEQKEKLLYYLLDYIRRETITYHIDDNNYKTICNNISEVTDFYFRESLQKEHSISLSKLSKIKKHSECLEKLNENLELFKGLDDNALVYFLEQSTIDLINKLLKEKKISQCQECKRVITFKNGKRYCSLSIDGSNCGKRARNKRHYTKHKSKIKNYYRKEMKDTRAFYKARETKRTVLST